MQPRRDGGADVGRDRLEHVVPGDGPVGFPVAAVKGHVHHIGRIRREQCEHVPVQQDAVGLDAHGHALIDQVHVNLLKIRVGQAFAAGEAGKHHALCDCLLHEADPLVAGEHPSLYARIREVDIAHPAVQVAQGRQLEVAGNGRVIFTGLPGRLVYESVVADRVHRLPLPAYRLIGRPR